MNSLRLPRRAWFRLPAPLMAGIILLASGLSAARATVTAGSLFTSNMVLQRDQPVPVWGTATAGRTITVTYNGQTVNAAVDAQGRWRATLAAMTAKTTGSNLTIAESGGNTLTFSNVVVGDVWICGGQSNMAWNLGLCDRQADIDSANYPVMRIFTAPLVTSGEPMKNTSGSWTVCSPSTASGFSAVAFYFGRKICQELGSSVPIGLYVASVGGTRIDPWLAPEGLTDIPVLAPLYGQSILPWGPFALFNGMVHPHAPLPAKGLIWYQGENAETTTQSADSYYLKMKALAQGYKRLLGVKDFAFYFVQLAYWGTLPTSATPVLTSGGWDADTRIQQANAMALPHAGMASAMDIGETGDMHPKNKLDVGERLALWALKNDYGRPITETSGPILRDVTINGSTLVCTFDHAASGLMVGAKTNYLPTAEVVGGTLQKFSVAGASGSWYAATATIAGNTVVVSSPSVANPRRVAYACWQNPVGANLYNRDGLPASPFYVDDVTAKYTVTATPGAHGSISPAGTTTWLKRQTARYTITPAEGYYVQDVQVDGVSVGAVETYTFDPLYANHAITATFAASAPNFTIEAATSPGGSISPGGAVGVAQGGTQAFLVSSTPGAITTLAVDGRSLGQRDQFTFGDVRENHTIAATFTFPITAQAGYGGSITPAGATVVEYGSSQTYTITPLSGFSIFKVTVDGANVGAVGSYTFHNVTASHTITATFIGTGGSGSVPQSANLIFSSRSSALPASGAISSWATEVPAGQSLTPMGSPTAESVDNVRFVRNNAVDYDGFRFGGSRASAIACTGASIVVVARPTRYGTSDDNWQSLVDVFYDRLVLGIMNGNGKICVRRNGIQEKSTATIPDGQLTLLTLVVQADGTYKVWANGVLVMDVASNGAFTSLDPAHPDWGNPDFTRYINVGRNNPDGWTTFNGNIGDVFLYKTALTPAERVELETHLVNNLTAAGAGTTRTITASAGAGGAISPSGDVAVTAGQDQTFTLTPESGHRIVDVVVDGVSVGAVATYTFEEVAVYHAIQATFEAIPPPPQFAPVAVGGEGNLTLISSGVTNGQTRLWTATNAALPIAEWMPIRTNAVGASGVFTNVLPINPSEPERFYRLSAP